MFIAAPIAALWAFVDGGTPPDNLLHDHALPAWGHFATAVNVSKHGSNAACKYRVIKCAT
jgi:hypothetical protein